MTEHILVTGGAGFIMSHFVDLVIDRGYKVTMIDAMFEGSNIDNFKHHLNNDMFTFIRGDLCNPYLLRQLNDLRIDYIVHGAAQSHVDRSISNTWSFVQSNIIGTHNILEWMLTNPYIKKFVYVNTDEVYGSIEHGYASEGDPLAPSSPYSASKASAGLLVYSYYITYGLPVTQTYCSNNFGPRQDIEKLIPKFITLLHQKQSVPLMKSVSNVRDWIYVLDHCEALFQVMLNGLPGIGYNIAGDNEKTNIAITHLLLNIFGLDDSYIMIVPDRLGHDKRYGISSKKIHQELQWSPQWSFPNALQHTVDWYVSQDN